jgi:GT2 family glycosyltransferase
MEFIESIKPLESYPRGMVFRQRVCNLQSLDELWEFALNHVFLQEELILYVERLRFVFNYKAKKEFFTDRVLRKSFQLFSFLLIKAKAFDKIAIANKQENPMMYQKVKKQLQLYINGINVLTELRANEIWNNEHLYEMLCISMDPDKLRGPIMRKIDRVTLMVA